MSLQEPVLRTDMGRKRHHGPRERNGRIQRRGVDRGTPELQSLREWYAGDGDPTLTSYPLGILLANNTISEQQYAAGCRYAWLHWAVHGKPSIGAVSYERRSRGILEAPERIAEEGHLKQIRASLARAVMAGSMSQRGLRVLDNLLIYEHTPRWMRPVMPRGSDVAEAHCVMEALEMLARAVG